MISRRWEPGIGRAFEVEVRSNQDKEDGDIERVVRYSMGLRKEICGISRNIGETGKGIMVSIIIKMKSSVTKGKYFVIRGIPSIKEIPCVKGPFFRSDVWKVWIFWVCFIEEIEVGRINFGIMGISWDCLSRGDVVLRDSYKETVESARFRSTLTILSFFSGRRADIWLFWFLMTQSQMIGNAGEMKKGEGGRKRLKISVPHFDNSALIKTYSKTMIGRCMNPVAQDMKALLDPAAGEDIKKQGSRKRLFKPTVNTAVSTKMRMATALASPRKRGVAKAGVCHGETGKQVESKGSSYPKSGIPKPSVMFKETFVVVRSSTQGWKVELVFFLCIISSMSTYLSLGFKGVMRFLLLGLVFFQKLCDQSMLWINYNFFCYWCCWYREYLVILAFEVVKVNVLCNINSKAFDYILISLELWCLWWDYTRELDAFGSHFVVLICLAGKLFQVKQRNKIGVLRFWYGVSSGNKGTRDHHHHSARLTTYRVNDSIPMTICSR